MYSFKGLPKSIKSNSFLSLPAERVKLFWVFLLVHNSNSTHWFQGTICFCATTQRVVDSEINFSKSLGHIWISNYVNKNVLIEMLLNHWLAGTATASFPFGSSSQIHYAMRVWCSYLSHVQRERSDNLQDQRSAAGCGCLFLTLNCILIKQIWCFIMYFIVFATFRLWSIQLWPYSLSLWTSVIIWLI